MGNRESGGKDDFGNMVKQIRKDQSKRINVVNPEKKFLAAMKEQTESAKLPPALKDMLMDIINHRISIEELINVMSVINALKLNDVEVTNHKSASSAIQKPESRNVFVKYDLSKYSQIEGGEQPKRVAAKVNETATRQKMRSLGTVLRKEINRIYHPFWKLNKIFAEFIGGQFLELLSHKSEADDEKTLCRLIGDWCAYIQASCLWPYKKWILAFTEISEPKYKKWIQGVIMQEIWCANNGYLYYMTATVISSFKTPLKININKVEYCSAVLTPSFFQIDRKLQIEGHFCQAIYRMSEIQAIFKPEAILNKLEEIKKSICIDIDEYHRLSETGDCYEIDSDNILGIVAYLLCHIPKQIDEIHTHIKFLRIAYGESVYFTMGVSSYMLSTICGAIEYIESPAFQEAFASALEKSGYHYDLEKLDTDNSHNASEQGKGFSNTQPSSNLNASAQIQAFQPPLSLHVSSLVVATDKRDEIFS